MAVAASPTKASEAFQRIALSFAHDKDVSFKQGKGFGSNALKVKGKIFAMISSQGMLVVKLPKLRVNQMVKDGSGHYFDPGHGRKMKEWVEYRGADMTRPDLVREARNYVGSIQHISR